MPPAPDVTAEEWENMAQAAAHPGIHYRPGFREQFTSIAQNLRDIKILGRPLYEVVADFGAGYAVKTAVKSGIMLAGASTLGAIGAAVVAGATSGAAFAGGKEWVRQTRENWQQPLSPEAVTTKQQILERLKDLKPNDWKKLGKVTLRGALVGAAFGLLGAVAADVLHAATSGPSGEDITPPATEEPLSEITTPTPTPTPTPFPISTPSADIPIPSSPDIAPSLPEASLPTAPAVEVTPSAIPTITETVTPGQADIPASQGEAPPLTQAPTPPPETAAAPAYPPDVAPTQPGELPPTPAEIPTEPGATPPPFSGAPPPPLDTITEGVQNLQDIPLEAGSNPWQVATEILKQVDPNHVPTNAEIMEVTRAICEQNNISVPEWNISGTIDEHKIPIGYLLKIDPEVKSVIASVVKGGK